MRQSPQLENNQRVVRLILLTVFVFFGNVASAQGDLQVESTVLHSTKDACLNIPGDADFTIGNLDTIARLCKDF